MLPYIILGGSWSITWNQKHSSLTGLYPILMANTKKLAGCLICSILW